jgi:hypothetical protein
MDIFHGEVQGLSHRIDNLPTYPPVQVPTDLNPLNKRMDILHGEVKGLSHRMDSLPPYHPVQAPTDLNPLNKRMDILHGEVKDLSHRIDNIAVMKIDNLPTQAPPPIDLDPLNKRVSDLAESLRGVTGHCQSLSLRIDNLPTYQPPAATIVEKADLGSLPQEVASLRYQLQDERSQREQLSVSIQAKVDMCVRNEVEALWAKIDARVDVSIKNPIDLLWEEIAKIWALVRIPAPAVPSPVPAPPVQTEHPLITRIRQVERNGLVRVDLNTGDVMLLQPLDFVAKAPRKDEPVAEFRNPRLADAICKDVADISRLCQAVVMVTGHTKGGTDGFWQALADSRAQIVCQRVVNFGADPRELRSRGAPGTNGRNAMITEIQIDLVGFHRAMELYDQQPRSDLSRSATPISQIVRPHHSPSAVSIAPTATVGIDTDGDGQSDFLVRNVDMNRDGIPDVLQSRSHQVSPAGQSFSQGFTEKRGGFTGPPLDASFGSSPGASYRY